MKCHEFVVAVGLIAVQFSTDNYGMQRINLCLLLTFSINEGFLLKAKKTGASKYRCSGRECSKDIYFALESFVKPLLIAEWCV